MPLPTAVRASGCGYRRPTAPSCQRHPNRGPRRSLARHFGATDIVAERGDARVEPIRQLFGRNVGVNGCVAPVRGYIPELLPEVLSGAIDPGRVFDLALPLAEVPEAYAAMDERRAVKVLLCP